MKDEPDKPLEARGDEALEARVLAWILGEASEFEAQELEERCRREPELALFARRMRHLHDMLAEDAGSGADPEWRLSEERREALLGKLGEVTAKPRSERVVRHFARRAWIGLAACLLLTVIAWPLILRQDGSAARRMAGRPAAMKTASAEADPHESVSDSLRWNEKLDATRTGEVVAEIEAVPGRDRQFGPTNQSGPASEPAPAQGATEFAVRGSGSDRYDDSNSEIDELATLPESAPQRFGSEAGALAANDAGVAGDGAAQMGVDLFAQKVQPLADSSLSDWALGGLAKDEVDERRPLAAAEPARSGPFEEMSDSFSYAYDAFAGPTGDFDGDGEALGEARESQQLLGIDGVARGRREEAPPVDSVEFGNLAGLHPSLKNEAKENARDEESDREAALSDLGRVVEVDQVPAAETLEGGDLPMEPRARRLERTLLEKQARIETEGAANWSETSTVANWSETSTADEPVSTFSLHVGDASFRLAHAALERGERPEPAAVRPEEFYNAFDYGDPAPAAGEPVACAIEQAADPVLPGRNLLRIAVRTGSEGRLPQSPLNLTLLLDNSGSMEREDRAEGVERAVDQLSTLLKPGDKVTVAGFARQPRLLAEQLDGGEAGQLSELVRQVPAEGGTNLEDALELGEELAMRQFAGAAQNRVVLFTDGAANLGDADPESLNRKVGELRQNGIAFDAAGFGADGLNDRLLERLTRNGDGRYYVVDRPDEAGSGFARQLAGAFRPAAENVKVQLRFNPERVRSYRLIGFEEHRLAEEDFRDDAVDAAELAAEEAGVALYQIELLPEGSGEVGELAVRFRDAASGAMVERRWTVPYQAAAPRFSEAEASLQLAGVAALAADQLKGDPRSELGLVRDLGPVLGKIRDRFGASPQVAQLLEMVETLRSR